MSDSDDPSTSFRDISTLKKWKQSLVPTVGDRKPAPSSAEPLNRVFLQSKHGPNDGVTRLSWSPEGIQPPVPAGPPRLAQNEVKWAISAGVQGPGLSVTLSGAEWEEWTWNADSLRSEAPRGPRRPRYPFPPLGGEQIMIRGPDPAAPKSQVTLRDSRKSARKSARARACVCHTGRILMQSRDQLAHLLLLALCLLRLWSGSPESRHTRMQLAGRENCSEDERGDDERTM